MFDDTINDTTNDTIKNRQSDIVSLIKKVPSITRKEIAQTLNISEPTVARDLKLLQEMGRNPLFCYIDELEEFLDRFETKN